MVRQMMLAAVCLVVVPMARAAEAPVIGMQFNWPVLVRDAKTVLRDSSVSLALLAGSTAVTVNGVTGFFGEACKKKEDRRYSAMGLRCLQIAFGATAAVLTVKRWQ